MPRRKAAVPFGEYVRSLDLRLPEAPEVSGLSDPTIPKDFKMSSLLPSEMDGEPDASPTIRTVEDFTDGMLRAVKRLNQDPELLREVSKRIS